jgi:hypothetical protein
MTESTVRSRTAAWRVAAVLTMLAALTLGPAAAAFATNPPSTHKPTEGTGGETEFCVPLDTKVKDVLTHEEVAAIVGPLIEQIKAHFASVVAADAAAALTDEVVPSGDTFMADYGELTVGELLVILEELEAKVDTLLEQAVGEGVLSAEQAAAIDAAFKAFVESILKALCPDDKPSPTESPTGTETPTAGPTASPVEYPSATPSASAGPVLADTGLGTPLLAGLVALALGAGAVLLGVTARPKADR